MNLEYPYQLTTFIDQVPNIGEPVYYGDNGWYPQIALKRRFKAIGISEDELLLRISEYCRAQAPIIVKSGQLIKPQAMPVKVIEMLDDDRKLGDFHNGFISALGGTIQSKYPEREGVNYFPHITAEFNDEMVIDAKKYIDKTFLIKKIFLLKDVDDENSVAYKSFELEEIHQL